VVFSLSASECWRTQLQAYLDRPFNELSPIEACVLLAGAFELGNYPQTPYRVIINESIELAKGYGGTDGHKYVNGVLDKLGRPLASGRGRSQARRTRPRPLNSNGF
jgi:N utilization substance protein B